MSKLSATLPWAVRLPFPTWSASGVSSTAPPRMVTVAGAVRVAEAAVLADAQRVERGGEAAVEPGQLAGEVGERADGEAGVGREAHRGAVGVLGRGVERGELEPGDGEVARR